MNTRTFRLGERELALDQPQIMAVLNLTPDSFYRGSRPGRNPTNILKLAERLANEGASVLDLGGASSRPGASAPSEQEEIDRVLPVLEMLATRLDLPLSVDTSTPRLMELAAAAGAVMINDIRALRAAGAVEAVARHDLAVCLMHMQGEPQTMQDAPRYANPTKEIMTFLHQRLSVCTRAGIDNILIDPGFGFGKTYEHNRILMTELTQFKHLGAPILVGLSRKSFLGQITGREVNDRLAATVAANALAVRQGAWMLRVHDVAANLDAIKVARYCLKP